MLSEYAKQLRRLKRFIISASERGFIFSPDVIPNKPKRITKASINKLKKITPEELYKKAKYIIPETGETVSGTEGRRYERSKASKKGAETKKRKKMIAEAKAKAKKERKRIRDKFYKDREDKGVDDIPSQTFATLENVREQISQWIPQSHWSPSLSYAKERDKNILENILIGAIAQQGEETVGQRLEENSIEINALLQEILYGSGSKEGNFKDGRTQVNFDLARFSAIVMGRPLTVDESIELTDVSENFEINN